MEYFWEHVVSQVITTSAKNIKMIKSIINDTKLNNKNVTKKLYNNH